MIPAFLFFVAAYGFIKKVPVFNSFVGGAKDGVMVVVRIFPYILAIFIAIKCFQSSGAYEFVKNCLAPVFQFAGVPVDVLSVALIKPLSGSASLGVFSDILKTAGPDSLAARISAVIMGSAETTFYVLAVYLGAVGIKRTRYLVPVCIIGDIIGIIIAITVVKIFFY